MKTIKAKEGKVFRRIVDKVLFGNEVNLGYVHHLHGVVLKVPVMELPEHFEEIDNPELNEPLLDEDVDMILEDVEETQPESKRVTLKNYLELEDKVNKLMEYIKSQDYEIQE